MTLDSIALSDFRCYESARFEFSPVINVISGENGAGKTSLLEAAGYFSTVRSFRRAKDADLIRSGCKSAEITAEMTSKDRARVLRAVLSARSKRELYVDGEGLSAPREMLGILPCVLFSPEDLSLVKGGPEERRRFLDISISQLRPRYVAELSRYRRLLEEKNKLLRLCAEKTSFLDALPEYNKCLSVTGAEVSRYRAWFCGEISNPAEKRCMDISGGTERLTLEYRTAASDPEAAFAEMTRRANAEVARGQCLSGAHRDDVYIAVNGRDSRAFCSQGQCRTAALSLKLAQRDVFAADMGEEPLLLLDDVLSELDGKRREHILECLEGGQIFITCCDEKGVKRRNGGKVVKIGRE